MPGENTAQGTEHVTAHELRLETDGRYRLRLCMHYGGREFLVPVEVLRSLGRDIDQAMSDLAYHKQVNDESHRQRSLALEKQLSRPGAMTEAESITKARP